MKRGTPGHPKTIHLLAALDISLPTALGHLELLWHWTADYAPTGDIGRYTPQQIAVSCAWEGDPGVFVAGLLDAGFLDQHPELGILVHDWPEHCDDFVHAKVARKLEIFADGTIPKTRKCNPQEVKAFDEWLKSNSKAIQRRLKVAAKAPSGRTAVPCRAVAVPRLASPRQEERHSSASPTAVPDATPDSPAPPPLPAHHEVFEFWRLTMGHPEAKFTSKREAKVRARLKEGYTVAQLCDAIRGCYRSPFHQGQNDGNRVYDDLELICRDGGKVESFIALAGKAPPKSNADVIRDGTAAGVAKAMTYRTAEEALFREEDQNASRSEAVQLGDGASRPPAH